MQGIRNIAIIAHVDHGKSTLVDAILKQTQADLGKLRDTELIMDSNELERERGITIFSKNAATLYKDTKINVIDTPGHADFGGEVERVLNMADGALLLVDAQEGPMPQTRFVLKKALAMNLKIIVVINKVDKPNARVSYAHDRIIDLFIELGASDAQLDFPVVYAVGKLGLAGVAPKMEEMKDVTPLLDAILKHIPEPKRDLASPFRMMVVSIAYDNYKGKIAIGRIERGVLKTNDPIVHLLRAGGEKKTKATHLATFAGLNRVETTAIEAGDIAAIAGIENVNIGDTIASADDPTPLPPISIEKPTVKMVFAVNTSPFASKEGTFTTSRNIKERLEKELDSDVALQVVQGNSPDEFVVSGRGELHLAILIEKMRREGFELQVSRPEVIMREENGKTLEPAEDIWIDVPEQYSGLIIEKMSARKGEMKNMNVENGIASFHFFIPTRGLIGFRNECIIDTKGTAIMNALFAGYFPKWQDIEAAPHGSLIGSELGDTTSYGLLNAQERGVLFVGPGVHIYEGQVVGQNAKEMDLVVNVCRTKQLNNFRAKNEAISDDLIPPRDMTLERSLEYIGDDELVEVTPKSIRIRKRILRNSLRK